MRQREDWASPAEEQEVHDDVGAPAAGGGDRGGSARADESGHRPWPSPTPPMVGDREVVARDKMWLLAQREQPVGSGLAGREMSSHRLPHWHLKVPVGNGGGWRSMRLLWWRSLVGVDTCLRFKV
ncbi:uncharacterized protein LOC124648127 [Lolium rigidum]|uniref:uncharacterized protein LOC124648127 n=1 Tax=Lolium rigidum TaxID=89674 RepID=UPI001F5CBEEE|nr:uncharacterized protein LOC124648127 [Lolium rigidum]